jgi:hypothetical protein
MRTLGLLGISLESVPIVSWGIENPDGLAGPVLKDGLVLKGE